MQVYFYSVLKDVWVDPGKYLFFMIEKDHVLVEDKISVNWS